jgi:UDP-N-acetylmuramate: L-alanyl-gamma-D-glutamyl-meso-diaminopimelate ligase
MAKHYHFIGICGTAMGSTALALRAQGHKVTGSDNAVYPPMSTLLADQGIEVMSGYKPENLPANADLFVVGNAISRGKNPELEALLDLRKRYTSMAELLKTEVIQGKRSFVVTGTHGKTTTTSLLTWLFESAGRNPGFMIGGVPSNFTVGARFTDSPHFVIEGDEYDTAYFDKRSKFLHYLPECAIVNNVEFDHADIFNNLDEIILSFRRMTLLVPCNGLVLINGDDANALRLIENCPAPTQTVGMGEGCALRIAITAAHPESTEFTVNGVFRRQTIRGEKNGIKVIDDFGHHPTAIRETLKGFRQKFPGARLWAVFEPRSNTSRRKVLQDDLITALSAADGSVIAAVNDASKVPEELRLSPEAVATAVAASGSQCYYEDGTEAIIGRLKSQCRSGDVIVIFSNGGFDGIHDKLLAAL